MTTGLLDGRLVLGQQQDSTQNSAWCQEQGRVCVQVGCSDWASIGHQYETRGQEFYS